MLSRYDIDTDNDDDENGNDHVIFGMSIRSRVAQDKIVRVYVAIYSKQIQIHIVRKFSNDREELMAEFLALDMAR